jgi:hypothetical protein
VSAHGDKTRSSAQNLRAPEQFSFYKTKPIFSHASSQPGGPIGGHFEIDSVRERSNVRPRREREPLSRLDFGGHLRTMNRTRPEAVRRLEELGLKVKSK